MRQADKATGKKSAEKAGVRAVERRNKNKKNYTEVPPATIGDVATVRIRVNGLKESLESMETLITLLNVF